jgi:hypothetical protein
MPAIAEVAGICNTVKSRPHLSLRAFLPALTARPRDINCRIPSPQVVDNDLGD